MYYNSIASNNVVNCDIPNSYQLPYYMEDVFSRHLIDNYSKTNYRAEKLQSLQLHTDLSPKMNASLSVSLGDRENET